MLSSTLAQRQRICALTSRRDAKTQKARGPTTAAPGYAIGRRELLKLQALKELPQPQVDLTFGLLNLKPEPSMLST